MRSIIAIGLLLFVCLAVSEAQAQSQHRIIGTWEMNAERSPGGPQRETRSYEQRDDGFFLYTRSTVGANGGPSFTLIAFKFDGKEYPSYTTANLAQFLTSETPTPTILTFKTLDANTLEAMQWINGRAGLTRTFTVSADGQTLTQRITGTDGQGRSVNRVRVFDRVQ